MTPQYASISKSRKKYDIMQDKLSVKEYEDPFKVKAK